jgi:hypothetical protein
MGWQLDPTERLNLAIDLGRSFSQYFQVLDDEEKPINLVVYTTLKAQVRIEPDVDSALLAEFTIEVPDPVTGELYLVLTKEQVTAIPVPDNRTGYWDIYGEDYLGVRTNLVAGLVWFRGVVTL